MIIKIQLVCSLVDTMLKLLYSDDFCLVFSSVLLFDAFPTFLGNGYITQITCNQLCILISAPFIEPSDAII